MRALSDGYTTIAPNNSNKRFWICVTNKTGFPYGFKSLHTYEFRGVNNMFSFLRAKQNWRSSNFSRGDLGGINDNLSICFPIGPPFSVQKEDLSRLLGMYICTCYDHTQKLFVLCFFSTFSSWKFSFADLHNLAYSVCLV
jgi:hypothetical protein